MQSGNHLHAKNVKHPTWYECSEWTCQKLLGADWLSGLGWRVSGVGGEDLSWVGLEGEPQRERGAPQAAGTAF